MRHAPGCDVRVLCRCGEVACYCNLLGHLKCASIGPDEAAKMTPAQAVNSVAKERAK